MECAASEKKNRVFEGYVTTVERGLKAEKKTAAKKKSNKPREILLDESFFLPVEIAEYTERIHRPRNFNSNKINEELRKEPKNQISFLKQCELVAG